MIYPEWIGINLFLGILIGKMTDEPKIIHTMEGKQ